MQHLAVDNCVRRGLRVAAVMACLGLAACSTPDSNTYTSRDVGQLIETSQGRVLSSRAVEIKDDEGGTAGALTGGAIGGAAGYGAGSGNGLATIVGAILGAGVGYLAEKQIRRRDGVEYVVELEDGRVVTLVQNKANDETAIADGEPVLVQFGNKYTRITQLDTEAKTSGGGAAGSYGSGGNSDWVNPDTKRTPAGKAPESKAASTLPKAGGSSVQNGSQQQRQ